MKPALLTDDMTALPSNAEFDLVNRYTGGRMTESEADAFEKMLDDPAFFYRVAPLIKLWYKRKPLPIEIEIGDRIEARRAAGLPLYEPSLSETVGDAIARIPVRTVAPLAFAAALAFVAVLRTHNDVRVPANTGVRTAQVGVDSQPTHRPTVRSSTKLPTVVALVKPPVTVDTATAQQPAALDTAAERALGALLASRAPTVQPGAATRTDPVTVVLNIPEVPLGKAEMSPTWQSRLKAVLDFGPKVLGALLSPLINRKGRTSHF